MVVDEQELRTTLMKHRYARKLALLHSVRSVHACLRCTQRAAPVNLLFVQCPCLLLGA